MVNGVIKGVNWVLSAVGSTGNLSEWAGVHFANGTDGLAKNTLGIVNDQPGSVYKELIMPPNGRAFIPEGRNVMLPLQKGTKIMPAEQTKALMGGMPRFKNGVGTVVATDKAGKTTTVTRKVTLDTGAPVFEKVTLTPNPVDCGKTFVISVKVTD